MRPRSMSEAESMAQTHREIMVNEEDLDYDNFEKVEADINGVVMYTYRKGDHDYLILEMDGGDYPLHYITCDNVTNQHRLRNK